MSLIEDTVPLAWYITFSDEEGSDNVLFFKTEEAAWGALAEMERINEEEGLFFHTYRGNRPTPLLPKDINDRFVDPYLS